LLGILLFPLNISAQDAAGEPGSKLTVHAIISGIILIITGIIFCFFGRRYYRTVLFLVGFYIGAIITWIILTNREPSGGFAGAASLTIILIVSLAVGFVVGLIFMCCSTIAVWFLGALAGYLFSLWILAWASDGLIHSKAGRIIFIIVLTLIGLLLAIFFKNTFIILGTAFIGAYAIILGIDLFARTGFALSVKAFMDGNHDTDYKVNTKVYLMLAGMIVLFILGSIFQYRYYRNHHFGPDAVQPVSGKRRFWSRHV
jgi:MFS family permease